LVMLLLVLGLFTAAAQEATPEVTPPVTDEPATPQQTITITGAEPASMITGQEITLSVLGTGFTSSTVVRLNGYGILPTTFISPMALTATVPASIPSRSQPYVVEVIDPSSPTPITSTFTLTVRPLPPPTAQPPTQAPPPTKAPPPTEIPGP